MPNDVFVELKYCERCGGLFLRRAALPQSYCKRCMPIMREIARPRPKADSTPRWLREQRAVRGEACV